MFAPDFKKGMIRYYRFRILFLSMLFGGLGAHTPPLRAQLAEKVFMTDYRINPENKRKLFIAVDNLSFFRNAESTTFVQKGYTLPGFWLQLKAAYYPTENIKLEGGLHSLWFWGATRYPAFAYNDIAVWRGEESKHNVHLLPYLRAHVALSDQVDLILGDLYGGSNHGLIAPLYNPELNLSSDPEAGVQILYHPRWMDLDIWLNWESFIYKLDTHQEAFTFGWSSRLKFNSAESTFHVYALMQALAQHRGGELDTISNGQSVQTMLNGVAGLGVDWNVRRGVLKKVNLEFDVAGYYQHAGNLWPLKRGYGWYGSMAADLSDFRVQAAYWKCEDFISLFGNPLYGAISTYLEDAVYRNPRMIYAGAEYTRTFGREFSLGINADAFYRMGTRMIDPKKRHDSEGDRLNYSFGVFFRFRPSFLIKDFGGHPKP